MRGSFLIGLLASASIRGAAAACPSALVIDNFSKWSTNTNTFGYWTSDDGTMTSISAASNKLSFKPSSSSYFYETFGCQDVEAAGYNSVQFTIKGPAGGSVGVELQTQDSCSSSSYASYHHAVTGLTGSSQTITIPLTAFAGANQHAVTAIVWSDFSSTTTTWELSAIKFGCGGSSGSTSSSTKTSSTSSTTSSSAVTSKTSVPVTSSTSSTKTSSTLVTSSSTSPPATCTNLLIDDWTSQSRLTFLYYNAMMEPSSDDGTMKSVVVSGNRVTLTPTNTDSYFYSQFGCLNAQNKYGGISLRIKAAKGRTFTVTLNSATTCGGADTAEISVTSAQLGWTFDGTEKLYSIPLSKFTGLNTAKLTTVLFSQLNGAVTFGPMAFYCGSTVSEYVVTTTSSTDSSSTVAAPTGTAAALVIDQFGSQDSNALGFWHGGDDGMTLTWGSKKLTIQSSDADYSFYTQVTATCRDMTSYEGSYLHIAYSGHTSFTIALQQHNSACNENIAPYPETWDSVQASRYASATDIYVPMSHFNINKGRVIGIALKGFYSSAAVSFTKIEIVKSVPAGFIIPSKLDSGTLFFGCTRPNSFAFAIDDGDPVYAQQVMKTIKDAGIKVTFFTVGAPLLDTSTNLTNVYNEMKAAGHQIAMHSFTHPKMEGLPDIPSIDWEYNNDIAAMQSQLGVKTKYFRPPFGTEGARMRQRLAATTGYSNPSIINWSVDVEDWLWAETSTPEKQLDAFKRDIAKGGNLVVLHYLYNSTVSYLPQFIQLAKATGKQLMRVDQCMQDPNAPAL